MKAMLLAAGVGSRLDPLTTQIPKPLVPVANRPVMEHLLMLLKRHQVNEVVSNLHHLPEKIRDYFGNGAGIGIRLEFRYERELSGDAGGVRACRDFLEDDTFLVVMGDLFTDVDLSDLIRQHKEKGALATIGLKWVEDVSQFGVAATNRDGFITAFQEKPQPHEAISHLASTGIYILEPKIFDYIPPDGVYGFGRQLFPTLVDRGLPVLGAAFTNYWSDVGTVKQYRQSNFDALDGLVRCALPGKRTAHGFVGEDAVIEPGCQIEGLVMLGKNSRLCSGVSVRGHVVIGEDCLVDAGAELENTIVWSSSNIERGAVLRESVIGFNCVVKNGTKKVEAATVAAAVS